MTYTFGPDSAAWLSSVQLPETVAELEDAQWGDSADFVVVGYGGAGMAAALEAVEGGLDVLAIDLFQGGGSTAMNGGVVYAGGGTAIQKEAGVEDNVEEMYKYLALETQGVIKDSTLRRFCEQSPGMIDWLTGHGVRFDSTLFRSKTSYPPQGYFLYHADSSLSPSHSAVAKPAARGHKAWCSPTNAAIGFGKHLTDPLRKSASRRGVRFMAQTEARQLIMDQSGAVMGLSVVQMPPGPKAEECRRLMALATKWQMMLPSSFPGFNITNGIAERYWQRANEIKFAHSTVRRIRALKGVCLSTGGFIQNRPMVKHYAPGYSASMAMGSPGDNGSGIRLGQTVGGAVDRLERISSWRFLNPPQAFAAGMLVNAKGERYVNEALYGAAVGQVLGDQQNGIGWLILDKNLYRKAKQQLRKDEMLPFQRQPGKLALLFARKARSLDQLAEKCGFDPHTLRQTADTYNRTAAGWQDDPFGKDQSDMHSIVDGPFYAIDVGAKSKLLPLSTMTVGGLKVDEDTGEVLRSDNSRIKGLYAAGRAAIGLPSHLYISGLSAADCFFSGRRAGAHAASKGQAETVLQTSEQEVVSA